MDARQDQTLGKADAMIFLIVPCTQILVMKIGHRKTPKNGLQECARSAPDHAACAALMLFTLLVGIGQLTLRCPISRQPSQKVVKMTQILRMVSVMDAQPEYILGQANAISQTRLHHV